VGQGQNPEKSQSSGKHKEKVTNVVPSSNNCSRFGGEVLMYPIHLPIASNNRLMSLRVPETCVARSLRPLPGRTWVGSFVRTGTCPPRNVMTNWRKESDGSFSCLSFTGQTIHSTRSEGALLTLLQGVGLCRLGFQLQQLLHPVEMSRLSLSVAPFLLSLLLFPPSLLLQDNED